MVYLNDAVKHFDGGEFAFQPTSLLARSPDDDGTQQAEAAADADTRLVTPAAGRVVLYDARLRHCVHTVSTKNLCSTSSQYFHNRRQPSMVTVR